METLLFRNRRLFGLVLAVIFVLGLSAYNVIGRQEDPTITNLFATVITPFPGADPGRVEALVTEKIEDELREIPEIDDLRSTSRAGVSFIVIELSNLIPDDELDAVWSEIRDALSDAARNFPPGVPEPQFDEDRTGAFTAISAVSAKPGVEASAGLLLRYAEILQDRLRDLPNTKHVRLFGEPEEEVRVTVDARRLAALGMTIDQVSGAIANADAKVEAGQLRGATRDLLIEVKGEIVDLDRIRAVPLMADADGSSVRVADVARVERTIREPRAEIAYADGVPAILIAARMEEDKQVDTWMRSVRATLEDFERNLPSGLEHRLLFDQSEYTADRFRTLGVNLATGVALVVIVLFVTLGLRAALVVASVIPLATLMSITALQWAGVPIHQMSVTGLIVALGLLVDAAIVMTDEIKHAIGERAGRLAAISRGVRRLAIPLVASTITTVLAFLPMVLLPGPAGDFVGSIAISVIIMLTASLILALTVTPTLAGIILPDRARTVGERRSWLTDGWTWDWGGRMFRRSIRWSLEHRGLSILAALVLPVVGFGAFPTLTAQFFPAVDRDQFYVQVTLGLGSSIEETERTALSMSELATGDEIRSVHWVIGQSAPAFYYNMKMDQDGAARFAEALVTTASPEATRAAIPELQAKLDAAFPGAQTIVRELIQGPPVDAPVELQIFGPDIETLRALGEEARALMAEIPEITHTRATLSGGEPKVVLALDEDKVRQAGLELGDVARQLEASLEGATGGSLLEATEELPVRVRLGDGSRSAAEALRALDVLPPDAGARVAEGIYPGIPLIALGTIGVEPSDSPIQRLNGERINTVQGFIEMGVLPQEAQGKFQALLEERPLQLPAGYRLKWGGDADARGDTVNNLVATLGLVVVLSIVTIVLTFNSYRLSLIAVVVCVLSMGLSFLALAIFDFPFGIQALIGSIGSIGVSINAAIIVMTALQEDAFAASGDIDAIEAVVLRASRHIFSTTITTVGGFLPLILGGGGFWPPFAMAIAGGVLFSMVVAFYFTPPMFALVNRKPDLGALKRLPAARALHRAAE